MDTSIIYKYFPDLSQTQKDQLEKLQPLYREWNEKINVISRKDIDELYERHVLHSLSIAEYIEFVPGTRILDVGTGGGFPGIPLAILFPNCHFHLVDSIGKKIKVCEEVSCAIQLTNLTAEHQRMEKVKGEYDYVVSRAVAPARQLYNWTKHLISKENKNEIPNGWMLLKGGDLKAELSPLHLKKTLIPLINYFEESFFETKQLVVMKTS